MTFTSYIYDDRYSVPTLDIVEAGAEDDAKAMAIDRLLGSSHYSAIDVCEDGVLRFSAAADRQ